LAYTALPVKEIAEAMKLKLEPTLSCLKHPLNTYGKCKQFTRSRNGNEDNPV